MGEVPAVAALNAPAQTPGDGIDHAPWWALWAGAALAWALGALCSAVSHGFCVDDAYIHLSYARSLRLGDGISYNPGDWETGASSPLWMLLVSPFALQADPVLPVQLLGVLLHGLLAWASASAAVAGCQPRGARRAALATGLLTAVHPGLLQGAISGMEVPLAALTLVLALLASLRGAPRLGFVAGALAVWSRPEALLWLAAFALLWRLVVPSRLAVPAAFGAAFGLLVWVAYDLFVSGHPWPNTRYAKAAVEPWTGLAYLPAQVVPHEPWLLGLGGVVLALLAFRSDATRTRRLLPVALLGAWLAASVAIAMTRELNPVVLFFNRRYFLPLSPAGIIALGAALGTAGVGLRRLWVLPVAALSLLLALQVQVRQRMQEVGIRRVHTRPAQYMARALPPDAVVLVEGAGATRFFTPRSMRIVDMIGLNDGRIAHMPPGERPCGWAQARPTHMLVPVQFRRMVTGVFEAEPLIGFKDPQYAQTEKTFEHGVLLLRVRGLTRVAAAGCGLTGSGSAASAR